MAISRGSRGAWLLRVLPVGLGIALCVLLALAGCNDGPHWGTVTSKSYSPGWSTMDLQCIRYSKAGACSGWIPVTRYNPERWTICLSGGDSDGCRDVDEQTYARLAVGGTFDDRPGQ